MAFSVCIYTHTVNQGKPLTPRNWRKQKNVNLGKPLAPWFVNKIGAKANRSLQLFGFVLATLRAGSRLAPVPVQTSAGLLEQSKAALAPPVALS